MSKKIISLILCLIVFVVAIFALIVINSIKAHTSVLLPADLKTHDRIKDSDIVVQVIPTGYSYITMFKGDSVKFRIVELNVVDTLKGTTKDTIMVLQTVGMQENPILKKGKEYLLFLKPYVGDIPRTEGVYVGSCAHWGYYGIDNGKIVPLYDELNVITPWLSGKSKKEGEGFSIQDMKAWINK